jgi:hypothetical protein
LLTSTKLVAGRVTQRIVMTLKLRSRRAARCRAGPSPWQPVLNSAVRQSGERVAKGLPGQLLEAPGELAYLIGLPLDGRHHAGEGIHERADLIVPRAGSHSGGLRSFDEAGRARDRSGEVPDDVGTAGHEEPREDDEGRDGDRSGGEQRGGG